MKTKTLLIVALPVAMAFAASSFAGEKEEKIQWSSVPAAVQKTITENSGGGKVEEIEKETKMKHGKSVTVYEAKGKKSDGKEVEIKVGEDGKLMEVENEEKIEGSSVPAAVQKTITESSGGGKVEEIEKETKMKHGKSVTVYEAKVKKSDGKEVEIKVGEDGKLIEVENEEK